ncbi:MAG: DNA alkylation repair protein [Defluviimonas sp.]|uniref:DNA alkylation repair protein n=1 Tax=Albidovulum sp. TaxID=1872424 RepID=UPI001DA8D423|nr:DNA alkylation repair protein [Paracoccaceae bacterium]MCC0064847.1 DNA alkylation repair protein [Defluviimonas sp.]
MAITHEAAIAALIALEDRARARDMAAYHKAPRRYLGIRVPVVTDLARGWRAELDVPGRVALADALWRTDIHEARIAAAKLLTQARIRDDGPVWETIAGWVPEFDAWAIADHACDAGGRRLVADPARLDTVETWTRSPHMWSRRAALVVTLPWTRQNHPSPGDLAIRSRVLGWAAAYADDRDWFIQKAVAWWLRDLSRHDRARVRAFLDEHGARLKAFARREAGKYL